MIEVTRQQGKGSVRFAPSGAPLLSKPRWLLAGLLAYAVACDGDPGMSGAQGGGAGAPPSFAGSASGGVFGRAQGGAGNTGRGSGGIASGGKVSAGSGGVNSGGMGSGGTGGGGVDGGVGTGGAGSSGTGGSSPAEACTPEPSGAYVTKGDLVLDQRTCLAWMQESVSGMGLSAAKAFCEGLSRGGFEDWRVPTASEAASLMIRCGSYPPMDTTVFSLSGDGIWTTTESGSVAGNENKVCGIGQNTGQYYDFGPVGAQHTRCVRGTVTVPTVKDCKLAQGCMNW